MKQHNALFCSDENELIFPHIFLGEVDNCMRYSKYEYVQISKLKLHSMNFQFEMHCKAHELSGIIAYAILFGNK